MASKIDKIFTLIKKVIERETAKLSSSDREIVYRDIIDHLEGSLYGEDDGDEDRAV